jgi:hypothetical protein
MFQPLGGTPSQRLVLLNCRGRSAFETLIQSEIAVFETVEKYVSASSLYSPIADGACFTIPPLATY